MVNWNAKNFVYMGEGGKDLIHFTKRYKEYLLFEFLRKIVLISFWYNKIYIYDL